ncbi:PEP-CTERM sorting domain-containing protein [Pseudorhodoferax sp.]|uniref:PEP-CTERM sorting domain-containing protein n=1 Tax=Pseudorhodoferax sp. TaxID=1993553 RepID=UPI002DD6B2EB|nr:PEP-CTERM sorting domain-containing protein [Pseudorhodoferax sp.]
MSFSSLARTVALLGAGCVAAASQAAVLTTADLTALEGSAWSAVNSSPVRLDFGAGYGMGSITMASINGGYYDSRISPYTGETYSRTLSNGDTLAVTNESVFVLGHGSSVPNGERAGIDVTFTLDSGNFAAGALLVIRSLDWTGAGVHQYFSPGSGLSTPLLDQLPTDFGMPSAVPVSVMGSDAGGDLYGASAPGIGGGLAFALDDDVRSFSFRLLTSASYGGGVALSFALPPAAQTLANEVPEPQTLPLAALGLGAVAWTLRRQRHSTPRA